MITLTERAATELKDLMASQPDAGSALRVWVQGGGCSGLSYGMALDAETPEETDNIFEHDGIKIYVDAMSLNYMDGSSVDDVLGGGFKIENPNAVSGCGCGSSFKTADSEGPAAGGCGSCGCK
jgi:iron-sulfur cluster assembly accessory protein